MSRIVSTGWPGDIRASAWPLAVLKLFLAHRRQEKYRRYGIENQAAGISSRSWPANEAHNQRASLALARHYGRVRSSGRRAALDITAVFVAVCGC